VAGLLTVVLVVEGTLLLVLLAISLLRARRTASTTPAVPA
jgi:hypothetical protein